MEYDKAHHEDAKKLFDMLGLESWETDAHDDIASVGDRWVRFPDGTVEPVGMKSRGSNSGPDFNLSAWSAEVGDLPEYKNAGGKLYLYKMRGAHTHVLVRHPPQEYLNSLLPERWYKISADCEGRIPKGQPCGQHGWVRYESPNGMPTHQGVIFVPRDKVEILAIWDANFNLVQ